MAKLDFPTPPTLNEVWLDPMGQTWIYNGDAWVRTKTGSGIPEPTRLGVQMARQVDEAGLSGKWVAVAVDVWYLGAYASPPILDNNDEVLQEGHVYLNTVDDKMYSWDGEAWRPFAPTYEIFGLTSYTYELTGPLLDVPLTGADIYGNTPSGWIEGQTLVTIFRKNPGGTDPDTGGSRLSVSLDSGVTQDYTVNYANSQVTPVNTQWEAGDQIIVQISQIQLGQDASTFPWVDADPTMSGDSDTKVPTQKAVKTYVDLLEDRVLEIPGRNALSNGNFNIWQRGTSDVSISGTAKYVADRWYTYEGSIQIDRVTARFGSGRKYGLQLTGGNHRIRQVILDPDQFIPGSIWTFSLSTLASNAGNVGVTFYWGNSAKASTSGYSVNIPVEANNDVDRFSGQIIIPNRTTSNDDLAMVMITTANSGDAIFQLQFEEGIFASKFERINIRDELNICSAHFQVPVIQGYYGGFIAAGSITNFGLVSNPIALGIPMAKAFAFGDIDDGKAYKAYRIDGAYTNHQTFTGATANPVARQGEFDGNITHWYMTINNDTNQANLTQWGIYQILTTDFPGGVRFWLDADYY